MLSAKIILPIVFGPYVSFNFANTHLTQKKHSRSIPAVVVPVAFTVTHAHILTINPIYTLKL